MARRVRGGIQRVNMSGNTAYSWRQVLQHDEKQAIAREVAQHVPNGVSVAFSIGTTPEIICSALLDHDQLRIFTNNLNLALLACSNPGFEVTVAGGRLRNEDRDILGLGMVELFQAYRVDIGIYGVAGVDEDGTLLDFYEEEVRARQIIRQNSREKFLVLDHSKFNRRAHVRGGHIHEASKVFCDRTPRQRLRHDSPIRQPVDRLPRRYPVSRIDIKNLTKTWGGITAVDQVSFTVPEKA